MSPGPSRPPPPGGAPAPSLNGSQPLSAPVKLGMSDEHSCFLLGLTAARGVPSVPRPRPHTSPQDRSGWGNRQTQTEGRRSRPLAPLVQARQTGLGLSRGTGLQGRGPGAGGGPGAGLVRWGRFCACLRLRVAVPAPVGAERTLPCLSRAPCPWAAPARHPWVWMLTGPLSTQQQGDSARRGTLEEVGGGPGAQSAVPALREAPRVVGECSTASGTGLGARLGEEGVQPSGRPRAWQSPSAQPSDGACLFSCEMERQGLAFAGLRVQALPRR